MRISNRLVCLLLALMLVVPAAAVPAIALGQSAGDDQYVDPFQDDQTGKDKGSGSGGSGNSDNGNNGNNSASQGSTGQSNSDDPAGTTATQNSADNNNSKLPHTGLPEGWLVAIGVLLLLGGGFVLRRVWPRPD